MGPPSVAAIEVTPDSSSVERAGSLQLSATVRDRDGGVLTGRTITWTTSDDGVASVSSGGLVSASFTPGRSVITATSEGRSGSAVVVVDPNPLDVAVVGAQLTQGVQDAGGTIPMILQGNGAVVNVLVRSTPPVKVSTPLVLHVSDAVSGELVHADTVATQGSLGADPDYASPSAQFLIPPSELRPGLTWQVFRDPDGGQPDDSVGNDVYPRGAPAQLSTIDVPTLKLRFVPIVLASHANARGDVSSENLDAYLRVLLSALPLGRVDVEVGEPFTSSVSFGSPPRGGDSEFWVQVLSELDAARVADPDAFDAHWYGVVRPPSGFNYTESGGWAYIPLDAADAGSGTRTALGVQVGWFSTESQARDLVAHELGHNFGRRHSPCGNPSSLDPDFPVASGLLGRPGHDAFAWTHGLAPAAPTVSASTGDVMGYCHPVWSSTYTYGGILAFRTSVTVAAVERTRVLLVRGTVDASDVRLEPAFAVDARPTPPGRVGSYRLEGVGRDGGVLFTRFFEPAEIDHVADRRTFGLAVPLSPALEQGLDALRVTGPDGRRAVTSRSENATPRRVPPAVPAVVRDGLSRVRVTCASPATRGVMVWEAGGRVLAVARDATALLAAPPAAGLVVACSDGVHTDRFEVEAP